MSRKRFNDFDNGDIMLEKQKNHQNAFKSDFKEIKKGRFKSEEQKSATQNIEML